MSRSSRRRSINDIELPPNLLKKLSVEVLRDLNKQDDATFYQFFEGLDLDEIKKTRERVQKLRETNQALAIQNVELEPKFNEAKTELREKAIELNSLKEEYDKKFMELKMFQGKTNHQAMEKELVQAAKKVEKDSEEFASDFANGKLSLSLEEFQEQYVKQRRLYWLRKVKMEKMKELMMNYRPTPAPRHHSTPEGQPTPYPTPPPLQSLPVGGNPGYPPNPTSSIPHASLPPYPHGQGPMPQPSASRSGPFAYTKQPPGRPVPYGGSGPNSFNQHRF